MLTMIKRTQKTVIQTAMSTFAAASQYWTVMPAAVISSYLAEVSFGAKGAEKAAGTHRHRCEPLQEVLWRELSVRCFCKARSTYSLTIHPRAAPVKGLVSRRRLHAAAQALHLPIPILGSRKRTASV